MIRIILQLLRSHDTDLTSYWLLLTGVRNFSILTENIMAYFVFVKSVDCFICSSTYVLCRIYTFARVARRIARRTTSVPITYSLCHSLRHSPHHSWRSLLKRFFEHESKGTNGDSRFGYKHVNARTHVKTVHSQRDRGIQMFVQVARRGTSRNA